MTEQLTIDQMNEVIAVFDGWIFNENGTVSSPTSADKFECRLLEFRKDILNNYHSDWNWIRAPAKKIAGMIINHKWENTIEAVEQWKLLSEGLVQVDIEKVHRGVFQLIQWLNKQQP